MTAVFDWLCVSLFDGKLLVRLHISAKLKTDCFLSFKRVKSVARNWVDGEHQLTLNPPAHWRTYDASSFLYHCWSLEIQFQCIHSDTSDNGCVWVDGTSWLNPPQTPPGGSLNLFLSCLTWAARHVALHSDLALHICLHQKSLQHKPNSSAQSSLFWLIHLRNLL